MRSAQRAAILRALVMAAASQLLDSGHSDESRQSGHEDSSSSDSDNWQCPSCHDEVDPTQQLACDCGYRVRASEVG